MQTSAIKVKGLTKTYRLYGSHLDRVKETFHPFKKQYSTLFNALNDVNFEIHPGETFGIVGRNGSGKSTLLQILSGVLQPSAGEVFVNGRVSSLLELGVGFNPEFPGIDNIYLSGAILGFSRAEMEQKIDAIIAFADIGDFIHQPVKTYSSGMVVRLGFAIYSIVNPDIFIVDEALAVGDAYFVHRCMLRFNEMQAQGKTILLVSHDASTIKRLCKRALWLDQGRLKMIGDSSEVVDHYIADLFKQKFISSSASSAKESSNTNSEAVYVNGSSTALPPERHIPNIDKRIGNQECRIIGVGLYDQNLNPIATCLNRSTVVLRVSYTNVSLEQPLPLAMGYILRDFRGNDLASTNSELEGVKMEGLKIGEIATIRIKIELPWIYPGPYSLSPSLSYIKNGEHVICDRILNALVFELTSNSDMFVFMRLATQMEVEGVSSSAS